MKVQQFEEPSIYFLGVFLLYKFRKISLYFASIGIKDALFVLLTFFYPLIFRPKERYLKLTKRISAYFFGADIYLYKSARSALASCLSAMKIAKGNEVILSSFTCLAVPASIIAVKATPIYCDIDLHTLNMTIDSVKKVLTPKTKAIIVQHTLGSMAPIYAIKEFASQRGIFVIEDCALSFGSKLNQVPLGSIGDAAIVSMELSKTLSIGWGGILIINNKKIAIFNKYKYHDVVSYLESLRMAIQTAICGLCYNPHFLYFLKYIPYIGYKLRIFKRSTPDEEIHGVISERFVLKLAPQQVEFCLYQWKRLDYISNSCMKNAIEIRRILSNLGYIPLGHFPNGFTSVSPRVSFLVSNRRHIKKWFQDRGFELGEWFDGPLSPLPENPIYNFDRNKFSNSNFISKHIVNIPCHNRLTKEDMQNIKSIMIEYSKFHLEDRDIQLKLKEKFFAFSPLIT